MGALTDTGEHDAGLEIIATAAAAHEAEHTDDTQLGVMIYGTWGRLLSRTDRKAEARPHLARALQLATDSDLDSEVALTHLHLGNTDLADGNIGSARECYERALDVAQRLPPEHQLRASILQNLASMDLKDGKVAEARLLIERGLGELGDLPEGATPSWVLSFTSTTRRSCCPPAATSSRLSVRPERHSRS